MRRVRTRDQLYGGFDDGQRWCREPQSDALPGADPGTGRQLGLHPCDRCAAIVGQPQKAEWRMVVPAGSIAERTGRTIEDGRPLSFLGGLAEGAETIAVHSLWLLLPTVAWRIALVWAAVVAVSAEQRIMSAYDALS